jgi:hypothetical protein
VPQPVGSGIVWAGYNDGIFEGNRVFDNWRQGTMLLAVPDALAGEPDGNVDDPHHCNTTALSSTSCDNRHFDNRMGEVPPGFEPHPGITKFGNQSTVAAGSPSEAPNGVDFWWDEYPGNDGNCWFDNTGPDGTADSLTLDAGLLSSNCSAVGVGNVAKEGVLLACFLQWEEGQTELPGCSWFDTPAQPATAAARAQQRRQARADRRFARSDTGRRLQEFMDEHSGDFTFGPHG